MHPRRKESGEERNAKAGSIYWILMSWTSTNRVTLPDLRTATEDAAQNSTRKMKK
jgi:hypothetical protein